MASSETIRDAAFIAATWDIEAEDVRRLAERDRLAALAGFAAAIQEDENRVWALIQCLDLYSVDELEQAEVPDFAVEQRRMQLTPSKEQLAVQQAAQERLAQKRADFAARRAAREAERAAQEKPPTLSDVLKRERSEHLDVNIAHNSRYFASQIADLSEAEADELRRRLDQWWPEKPYAETITRTGGNSWSQENFAAAWLWFGPPLDKDLTPRQWAEIACSGILFHDQTEWLKRKATTEGKLELAQRCEDLDTRAWHQALQATPDPLPNELVEAIVTNLKTADEAAYGVSYIGERLYEAAGSEPLRALSAVSDEFAEALRPLLARHGDEEAQAVLIKDLRRRLEAGERPEDRTLGWIDAVTNVDALDDLFACVALLYGPSRMTETAAWYPRDVLTPVMSAIHNIGGRKAVEGYDKLMEDPDYNFRRGQRDAIAQSILQADGLEAAEQATRELGLPSFGRTGDSRQAAKNQRLRNRFRRSCAARSRAPGSGSRRGRRRRP
jgi:hypothetical protein